MENTHFRNPKEAAELEEVIRANIQTAHYLRKELKVLEEASQNLLVNNVNNLVRQEKIEREEQFLRQPEEEEYSYYYCNLIKALFNSTNCEDRVQVVIANLPVVENKNYQNIINRIKLEIIKEIYELEGLKFDETDLEFINEIEKEQQSKKNIMELIECATTLNNSNKISQDIAISNKLIFLRTEFGSVYLERDLCGNEEYFESFQELLISIENGTFKNVKQFDGNSNLRGISEVKGFKTRILFERLTEDTYVILGAFIKKSDKAKDYINRLVNRIDYYRTVKSSIGLELSNPEYLVENELLRDSIINGLNSKQLVKTYGRSGDC